MPICYNIKTRKKTKETKSDEQEARAKNKVTHLLHDRTEILNRIVGKVRTKAKQTQHAQHGEREPHWRRLLASGAAQQRRVLIPTHLLNTSADL